MMSTMIRILVIGGTGNIGREVVLRLVANNLPVRALTRKSDEACMPSQVEVVPGDLTSPETLDGCLAGIDAVFLVWTAPLEAFGPALERIAKYARRLVFLSAPLKTPHPFFQQPNPSRTQTEQIERMIETSGLDWTFLRPGMLASNSRHWWARQICDGDVVRWPYLSVPTAPIDERDIAAVAVRALYDDGHAGADYVLTGPQSLSQFEQISTIGRVIGRTLACGGMQFTVHLWLLLGFGEPDPGGCTQKDQCSRTRNVIHEHCGPATDPDIPPPRVGSIS